jgi:hypothetical protein
LAGEAGEDAERANAFGDAAGERDIAFAEAEHLRALDHAGITGGAGGAERVMRAGDAHVERDLAGGVVGDRARVVVMRPNARVVIVSVTASCAQ